MICYKQIWGLRDYVLGYEYVNKSITLSQVSENMKKPKFIIIAILAILFIIILVQNMQVVTLRLFFWEIGASQIILIPLTMLIGFVIGFVVVKLRK